jgi:Kef-type K+ transport system membrane component KefB
MTGLTFLILFLLLMTLMLVVPKLLQRFFVPSVIAVMITGIIIGPNAFDVIRKLNHFLGRGYPTGQLYIVIEAIGLMGLVFLMSLAGMEAKLQYIKKEKKAVFWLSLLTFLISAAAGFAVFYCFRPDDWIGQLFYASLFASHSVGIVFPIIRELKAVKTRFGVAVLSATIITDIASLMLLAVCVQLVRHRTNGEIPESISIFDHIDMSALGPWFYPVFITVILLFIFVSLKIVPVIGRIAFRRFHPRDDSRLTFYLVSVLGIVLIGEVVGVSVIVGAFIAGMALANIDSFNAENRLLHKKIEGTGYGFFIPFMFLSIGMKTDVGLLFNAGENIRIIFWTVTGLIGSKMLSGWLAMRLAGFSNRKGLLAGLMTVPQLSATLAAAAVGLSLNIIPYNFFNAVIVLSIFTTIPVPVLVKYLIKKMNITFTALEYSEHDADLDAEAEEFI